jgi:hypothetical protein
MSLSAVIGHSSAIEGRKASAEAVRTALQLAAGEKTALAFILASGEYPVAEILNGAAPVLGETPTIGVSTCHELTPEGLSPRSVVVALLTGDSLHARTVWLPGFAEDREGPIEALSEDLAAWEHAPGSLAFIAADGLGGDVRKLAACFSEGTAMVGGCLAGGNIEAGRTFQVGGTQGGSGGLAAAWMSGIGAGIGYGHGWQPVGSYFQVTQADGPWVHALDGKPPAEAYARLFGIDAREWSLPPLNTLVRLYPLGVEVTGSDDLAVHSPLRVEADGSLRMSLPVSTGSTCHVLVGSPESCIAAARGAAANALISLGKSQPVLAIVLVDIAWKALFEAQPRRVVQAVRAVLGPAVPLIGGFTFGQLARSDNTSQVAALNQHIVVLLLGEET